jgi:hypothetical protein
MTTIICHFPLPVRRSCGQPAECGYDNTAKERTGSGGRQLSDKIMSLWDRDTTQYRQTVHGAVGWNLKLPDLSNVGRVRCCRLSLERKHTRAGKSIGVCRCNYNFSGRYCQLFSYNKSILTFMHISNWWTHNTITVLAVTIALLVGTVSCSVIISLY